MASAVYFGNKEYFVAIPAPHYGADGSHVGMSSTISLLNGGAIVEDSIAQHREFSFDWLGDPATLRVVKEFVQGVHGSGPYYWTDPFAADTNLFSPGWATPRLAQFDWKPICDSRPSSFVATPANVYGHPGLSAVYTPGITSAVRRFTIPIIPGMSLWFGASGSVTGTARINVRVLSSAGLWSSTPFSYTPLSVAAAERYLVSNDTFSYASGARFVEVYLYSGAAADTITLTSLVAKLVATGTSPAHETMFVAGEGTTGLRFSGGLKETLYTVGGRTTQRRKGFALKLIETEAWEL